jgi:hypothetical protein
MHRLLRELRDFSSNHTKQHYTYQYMSYSDSANHTITTSVSIRVTPLEDYLVSWGILWSGFVLASIIAAWQVYREQRIFKLRRADGTTNHVDDDESSQVHVALGDGESVSTADLTRSMVRVDVRFVSNGFIVNKYLLLWCFLNVFLSFPLYASFVKFYFWLW